MGFVPRFAQQIAIEFDNGVRAKDAARSQPGRHGPGFSPGEGYGLLLGTQGRVDGFGRIADDDAERYAKATQQFAAARRPGRQNQQIRLDSARNGWYNRDGPSRIRPSTFDAMPPDRQARQMLH
jgi:hypothetical protein